MTTFTFTLKVTTNFDLTEKQVKCYLVDILASGQQEAEDSREAARENHYESEIDEVVSLDIEVL